MSHHKNLRENKRCENCGRFVEMRFCPHCGQENVETRRPFHYLFTHFVEDFLHYDTQFWKTIQYLLFRPAKLTKEYLSGKRMSFVSPVKLYIFISFITFFIPAVFPDSSKKENTKQEATTQEKSEEATTDITVLYDKGMPKEKQHEIMENIKHHFPQAVFCYMPIFAFWLWVFHNKKKWYYFDHGIFTLHYFSFILLSFLLYILTGKLLHLLPFKTTFIYGLLGFSLFVYYIYYFFHSHRLVYRETKAISRLKCILLFFTNTFCIILFLVLYIIIVALVTDQNLYNKIINTIHTNM
jgi:hypothetical protein